MFNRKNKIEMITGIDIGSTAIRVAVGQAETVSQGKVNLQIVATSEVLSEGINKGIVTSIEDCVSSVSNALEIAERQAGVPIERAWVGVSGMHATYQDSKGVIAVAKPDGEIGQEDVDRAVEAARAVTPPLNYEILHVIPRGFTVDGQIGIKDPIGMTGIRLEVDTRIILGLTAHLKNITKAVYRTGIDIDNVVWSILSTGNAVTTSRQRELGVSVINIGSSVSTLIVFEGGEVIHLASLPIGSEHITNDLAIGLKSSIDVAERAKINYGFCLSGLVSKKEKLDLIDLGAPTSEEIPRRYVAEIIEARVTEFLEKANDELRKVNRQAMLPAGIVFTGGGAKILGLIELAKEVMALPVSLGFPVDVISSSDKTGDLAFAPVIGLVKWGANLHKFTEKKINTANILNSGMKKIGKLFRSLIP